MDFSAEFITVTIDDVGSSNQTFPSEIIKNERINYFRRNN